ncbi:MAG: 30S ribosomal protein S6 [Myxococcales bacterium]|nr:30S ribosomal protein S6 [Myxococcales bacterium]
MGLISTNYREYETIYVLRPEIEDSLAKDIMLKLKALVEAQGGINLKVSNWGRKKLAWERKKYQRGLYVHHAYLALAGVVEEFERNLAINENVLLRQTILVSRNINPADKTPEDDELETPVVKEKKEGPRRREDFEEANAY